MTVEHDGPVVRAEDRPSQRMTFEEILKLESASSRVKALEECLQETEFPGERQKIFVELVRSHGEMLVVDARRKAATLGLVTVDAGDEAVSEAFIRLTRSLNVPWPAGRTFLHRFRGEVWTELRHRRARLVTLRNRFPSLEDLKSEEVSRDADPEQRCQGTEKLHRVLEYVDQIPHTEQQRRLVDAWKWSKLGYKWTEVAARVDWDGSCESLRVSVSRLFRGRSRRIRDSVG